MVSGVLKSGRTNQRTDWRNQGPFFVSIFTGGGFGENLVFWQ